MDALALLQRAASAGFKVTERDGELVVRGPRSRPELIQELRASKEAVLNALRDEVARAPVPPAWIEIDGTSFSPAAADLYRRSVPFSADAASDRCRGCSGTRWWRLRAGCPWVCARCSPTDRADNEVEWREGGPPALGTDPNATPPSASLAPTLNPEVAHE